MLTPIASGFLAQEKDRNVNWLPQANPVSYSTTIVGSAASDKQDEKREMVDSIIIAIHKIDPLDMKTIKALNKAYDFIGLKSTKDLLETEKNIREKLNIAYACGSAMGLFAQVGYPGYPAEWALVGEYIKDPQDLLNIALSCKQATITGALETEREADIINRKIFKKNI